MAKRRGRPPKRRDYRDKTPEEWVFFVAKILFGTAIMIIIASLIRCDVPGSKEETTNIPEPYEENKEILYGIENPIRINIHTDCVISDNGLNSYKTYSFLEDKKYSIKYFTSVNDMIVIKDDMDNYTKYLELRDYIIKNETILDTNVLFDIGDGERQTYDYLIEVVYREKDIEGKSYMSFTYLKPFSDSTEFYNLLNNFLYNTKTN